MKKRQGTEDGAAVHRRALGEALRDALQADPHTRGLELPEEFEITPRADGHLWIQLGCVDMVANSQIVTHAWNVGHPDMVRQAELHDVVELAKLSMRRAAQAVQDNPPPPWAVLVHPVALALCLGHDSNRTRYPLTVRAGLTCGPHAWNVDEDGRPSHPGHHFVAAADCWIGEERVLHVRRLGVIAPRTMSALTFTATSTVVASLSIPGQLPEVLKTSLKGRALGEVFELPPSGYPDVDYAANRCRIEGYEELANGVSLQFDRADHIPYGVAADEPTARAMRLAPPHL